jgi:predicted esterase
MKMRRQIILSIFVITGILIQSLIISGCGVNSGQTPTTQSPTTQSQTAQPTLTLDQTSAKYFMIDDFSTVHAADANDPNKFLIFGNLTIAKPGPDLPPELAVFLGRWEGYDYAPPVKKDRKLVLAITEMNTSGGKAYGWSGTNLQFPDVLQEIQFKVVNGNTSAIEWQFTFTDGSFMHVIFTYDKSKDELVGNIYDQSGNVSDGPYELTRDRNFFVYQNYEQYLESKNITIHAWQDTSLQTYGHGYMLYLPEGYETDTTKSWPLLFFLHGYGDRGSNLLVLAKASPFMYIREKGPLPFIIAAPLLTDQGGTYTFPNEYMDGAMAEIRANFRVDDKRIYLTGLSMGGEGTWKFALHQPDLFAAIAPLSAYYSPATPEMMATIKNLPVWAIHGADDTVVPLSRGEEPVNALKQAGGNIKFTILPGHDHDVWTDTYLDPAFYNWLLQQKKA